MQKPRWVRSIAFGLILFVPCQAGAAEFVFVGTRQVGMGGAGVAATFDATAGYWNPAALAMSKKGDIRLQGSGGAVDRGDFFDRIKEINQFNFADTSAANRGPGVLRQFIGGWSYVGRTPMVRGLVLGILAAFSAGGVVVGSAQSYALSLSAGSSTFYLLFAMIFLGLAIGIAAGPKLVGALSRRRSCMSCQAAPTTTRRESKHLP